MNIVGMALYVENSIGCDLEFNKVYPVVEADVNDPSDYLRIVDESGEDYIYPKAMFKIMNLPTQSNL